MEVAYTVGPVLGQGGCGITYAGADTNLRRAVAIKEFFPPGSTRMGQHVLRGSDFPAALEQFLEEARALARFRHPGIVNVLTIFEENNTAYMVMELLKGKNLEQLVEETGPLPEKAALAIITQIAQALAVVHKTGFIHRDIKPANAIRCDDKRVVLIDFGLNKKLEVARPYQTRQLTIAAATGTEGYAPPEQYLKGSVQGIATDIYALGATLYFLLTGTVPVSAPERAIGAVLPAPAELNSGVSDRVSQGILKAMELQETRRFSSIEAMLGSLTARGQAAAPPSQAPARPPVAPRPAPASSPSLSPPAPPSNWLPTPSQSNRCPRCGSVVPQAATQCGACNTQLTRTGQRLQVTDSSFLYVPCLVIFLAGIVCLLFWIWAFHT